MVLSTLSYEQASKGNFWNENIPWLQKKGSGKRDMTVEQNTSWNGLYGKSFW